MMLAPKASLPQASAAFDTLVYHDSAAAVLVRLAQARHQIQSLRLAGYRAKVFTRMEGHVAAGRFGPGWTVFKYETAARLHWARSGDIKVDIEGARMAGTRMPGFARDQMAAFFEDIFSRDVWFIPSSIGDEITLLGLPDAAALHPFARGAEQYYRYEITDSLRISHPHRTVRIMSLRVEPRDPSMLDRFDGERRRWRREREPWSFFSGRLWIDADSLDVVRLTGAFVGEHIWEDDPDAPRLVNLEADVEYGLHQNRYWLPHRQVLSAHWVFKYLPGADLVGSGITTLSDYEIDLAESEIAFVHEEPGFRDPTPWAQIRFRNERGSGQVFGRWFCPNAWDFDHGVGPSDPRCGGSSVTTVGVAADGSLWEINLPTLDSLQSFDFGDEWGEAADLASTQSLENSMREIAAQVTGSSAAELYTQPVRGVDWQHVYNAVGYNRVQGPSIGGGYQWDLWPAYTTLHLNARYGFADRHLLGSGTWRRDGVGGRFELSAYRAVQDVEPWTDGTGVGNSLKALVFGHDDADYYLAPLGLGVSYRGYAGWFKDGHVSVTFEREQTMQRASSSPIGGTFQLNPAIVEGNYARGTLSKSWYVGFSGQTRLTLGAEGLLSADSVSGRFWGAAYLPYNTQRAIASLRLRAGAVVGSRLPQMDYRVGGPSTVRGYVYGLETGRTFWSAQGDLEWVVSQWWSPVVFADVGAVDFSETPLVGVGGGVSLLSGWARLDLAQGLTGDGRLRFDVVLQIPVN